MKVTVQDGRYYDEAGNELELVPKAKPRPSTSRAVSAWGPIRHHDWLRDEWDNRAGERATLDAHFRAVEELAERWKERWIVGIGNELRDLLERVTR